eukprot:203739_1
MSSEEYDIDIKDSENGYPNTEPVVHQSTTPTIKLTAEELANDGDDDGVVSTKSPNMGSALAMWQRLSTPKTSSNGMNGSFGNGNGVKKTAKKKKGKRFYDFREFASGAFSVVFKGKDKENGDKIVAVKKIHIGGSLVDEKYEPT